MRRRQTRPFPWPRRWLVTDERMGDALWSALGRLPRGSGVLLRHHSTPPNERERIGRAVARICRRRELVLAVSRDMLLARRLGAALVHNPSRASGLMPHSRSVHDEGEADRTRRGLAALVFVSPVFDTRSHAGATPLGVENARRLVRRSHAHGIALGGVNESRFLRCRGGGIEAYAGIDCWLLGPSRE